MPSRKRPKAFIIAAPSSGSGKTTLTLGLLEALRLRSLVIQPFKAGPDYIDAAHHGLVSPRPSYNLDTWMMGPEGVKKTFHSRMQGAHAGLVEGVMGLFDGKSGVDEEGSTAHLAKVLGLPVLFVVNAEKAARSVAALVKGFEAFDPDVSIRWVVFNKAGSPGHYRMLKDAVERTSKARVIGYLPKDPSLIMPERHLGLTTPADIEKKSLAGFIRSTARSVERFIDIDALLKDIPAIKIPASKAKPVEKKYNVRVAVAMDRAFSFYYHENLDILREAGAELVFFSPLKSRTLPRGTDGLYIGGGYPEVHAAGLEANGALRAEIKKRASGGLPVYAECGGLMYLGKAIETGGKNYPMAGLFPWTARLCDKRKALGYRRVRLKGRCPFLKKGELRGHEFHYSEIKGAPESIERAYCVTGGRGGDSLEGYVLNNTLASYIHLHFASNPSFAEGFLRLCLEKKDGPQPYKA